MRRPLAVICLIFIMAVGVYTLLRPPDLEEFVYADGMECRVFGTIYKIEKKESFGREMSVLYINKISYFKTVQDNQFKNPNNMPGGLMCYLIDGTDSLKIGNKVLISGKFEVYQTATNPGEFNSRLYYYTQGIHGQIKNAIIDSVSKSYNPVTDIGYRLRLCLEDKLMTIYPDKEAGILMTMLLGNKQELDGELKTLYREAGILHILSVSGLHISVLGYGLYRLLRRGSVTVRIAAVVSVMWMWFYGSMIGMGVSSFRAIAMFSISMLAQWWGRTYDLLTALAVAAAFLIAGEPLYLYHSGFWLSFSCVLAISLLYPYLKTEAKSGCTPLQKLLTDILNSFWLSVSVTVFTLPVLLLFYYEVSVWGMVWNLVVVPLASVVMGLGISTLCLPEKAAGMIAVIAGGNCIIIDFFEKLCRITRWSEIGNFIIGKPKVWQVLIFVSGLMLMLRFASRLKYNQRFLVLAGLVCFLVMPVPQNFKITFLDVGQGDGICIQNDNGNVYLMDMGSSDKSKVGTYRLLPFLKHEGVRRIEGIFLSHGDKDHISGIEELLEMADNHIRIERVILPGLDESALEREFGEIIELCHQKNIDIYLMSEGESLCDDKLMLTCVYPAKEYSGESNESSLVLYMVYKNFSTLLTGDIEGDGERILTDNLADRGIDSVTFLKVAHHGSSGSSSEEFLSQISPKFAIISCGENNSYGHPHKETVNRLADRGIMMFNTPESGAISVEIKSNGQIILIENKNG